MTNTVADAIADGLKSTDALSVAECAAIAIDAKLGRIEVLQERAAVAAERQADALETIAALFASSRRALPTHERATARPSAVRRPMADLATREHGRA
jgi:hypothetical protein